MVLLALAAVARGQGAGCDTDAVQCPDGSFVQRNPALQCNFDPCPQHACPTDARQCPDGTIVGRDIHNHCHWHDCPTDDESPSGAAGPLFARLNATKTFSVGNINNVSAMDVDEHFVYVATHDIIIKASKDNVDDFGVLSLDARSHLGQLSDFTAVRTLRVDATHIYTTAQKAGGHWLLKIDKDLMELISSVPFGAEDGAAKALALDASYVYTGMETNPGRVLKWRKDSLALAARLELLAADLEAGETAGEDNVQALVRDASDAAHLYALCGAMPGRVVQILTDNTAPAEAQMETGLRRVRALVLSEDTPMAGIIDSGTGHLYLGTAGSTARVLKVLAHSMARAGEVELTHANGTSAPMPGDVAAMQQDNDYLYVGMTSYPGTVVRVHKAPMSVRDEVRLAPGDRKSVV